MTDSGLSHLLPLPANYFHNESNGEDWHTLLHYRCNFRQLSLLASKLTKECTSFRDSINLKPLKFCIISSNNSSLLVPAIKGTGIRYGYHMQITEYSNTHPLLFLSEHQLNILDETYDFILVALNYEDISFWHTDSEPAYGINTKIEEFVHQLAQLQSSIFKKTGATILFQNIPRKPHTIFGHSDATITQSEQFQLHLFNQALVAMTKQTSSYLFDVASIAENEGLNRWYDERMWYLGKFAFSPDYLPLYADHLCRIISSIKGESRKCIVLDLDNTLWGGIVGQDGLEGINLGMGDPEGEAFITFQKYLLQLNDRGVILSVCSKNNKADAIEVFEKHPKILLKLDHIACFVVNWENKPTNITFIANSLNIGLESMVFIDDNPVERENVRRYLPVVAVPEMPEDPSLYTRTLSQAGYFELPKYTKEDLFRNENYQNNIKVKKLLSNRIDIQDGLAAIGMQLELKPFDAMGRNRIEQLINKSNQFNLTTRRYNNSQIKVIEESDSSYTLQVSLKDKFGDYGMISVLIGSIENQTLSIDTWLMSCRAIGREIEKAVFQEIVNYCFDREIKTIIGYYIKSDKNELVQDHYLKMGFYQSTIKKNITEWKLKIQQKNIVQLPFKITRPQGE